MSPYAPLARALDAAGRGGRCRRRGGATVGSRGAIGTVTGRTSLRVLPVRAMVDSACGDRHFCDQRIEGGVIAPLNIDLPSDFTLVLQTEVQAMRNGMGPAFASFTDLANLSHAVPGIDHLTASVEFTSIVNADRLTPDTDTFETALAYLATPNTQFDLGGFIGLNRAAPDFQVAGGVSQRF